MNNFDFLLFFNFFFVEFSFFLSIDLLFSFDLFEFESMLFNIVDILNKSFFVFLYDLIQKIIFEIINNKFIADIIKKP